MDVYTLADKHRAAVIAGDNAAKARLIDAYRVADADLQKRCAALMSLIEARRANGEDIGRAWILKDARFSALMEQVAQHVKALAVTTADETRTAVQTNLVSGTRDALALVAAAEGKAVVAGAVDRLNTKATENIVAYMAPDAPLGKLLARIEDEMPAQAVKKAKDVLLVGVATGQGPRVVAGHFSAVTGEALTRSLTVTRAEQLRAYRQASLQTYQDSEQITHYQWLSAKSARTCAACLAMDAKVFEKDAPFLAHVRCRCTVVPVVGELRQRQTGEDWLREQDIETQDKVMGPAAATAWRKGEVTLGDFVGVRHNAEYGSSVYHDSLKGARERAKQRAETGTIKVGNAGSNGAKDAGFGTEKPVTEARRLELEALAKTELDAVAPLVSDAVGLESKWSGRVLVDALTNSRGAKPFECDIKMSAAIMESGERGRTYIHEILHAHSVGYNEADFYASMGWEEGVVEQLQRIIRKRVLDGLPNDMRAALTLPEGSLTERDHTYNIYIAALEDLRAALSADEEAFYRDLLAQPIARRSAYLLMQRVMRLSGESREVAKQAYMKASGVMKRNLNNEELSNPRGIRAEVETVSRKLFGDE